MAGAKFRCSSCGFEKDVPPQYAGKRARCPKCQAEGRVSEVSSQPTAPAAGAALVKFHCPICDQKIGVPAQHAGKRVLCPQCRNPVTVPAPAKPAAPQAPKAAKRPEDILRVGGQEVNEGELQLKPPGDDEELLRMERDAAVSERFGRLAVGDSQPADTYPRAGTYRADTTGQKQPRKGLIAFIVIGSLYVIAALLAGGGVLALLAPPPESETIDIAPAQEFASAYIRLLAEGNADEARRLAGDGLRRQLDARTMAKIIAFAGTGQFEFSEEEHCYLEEGGQLGIVLTYEDKLYKPADNETEMQGQADVMTEPNAYEQNPSYEVSPGDQGNSTEAESDNPDSSSDAATDGEEWAPSRSIDLTLVRNESGFTVEAISTSGDKIEDFTSASSDLGMTVMGQFLASALWEFGGRFAIFGSLAAVAAGIVIVVTLACMWIVFSKAGQPGWAAIVPVYNLWVLAEIADKPGWWGLAVFFSGCIPYAGQFIGPVLMIFISIGVAKAFDRGIVFGLALWLVPFICYPILAFSD